MESITSGCPETTVAVCTCTSISIEKNTLIYVNKKPTTKLASEIKSL